MAETSAGENTGVPNSAMAASSGTQSFQVLKNSSLTCAMAERPLDGIRLADAQAPAARIALHGVTVYEPSILLAYSIRFVNQASGEVSIDRLERALELIYREDGYLLADVHGEFDPATQALMLTVDEGHLVDVQVQGVDADTEERMQRYLRSLAGVSPLDRRTFERRLALASDVFGVSMTSTVRPVDGGRGHVLVVQASRSVRQGSIGLDWVPLRPDHAARVYAVEERYGVLGGGDALRLFAVATGEPRDSYSLVGSINYRALVGDRGDYVEVYAGNAFSRRNFAQTQPQSEQRGVNAAVAWGYPFLRDLHSYGYVIAELEHADATSQIGRDDTGSQATSARGYIVLGRTSATGRLMQGSLALSVGRRPRMQAGAPDDGERNFTHLRGAIAVAGPWNLRDVAYTYRFENAAQWSSDALPEVERMALGHFPFLRGYAPAEVEGDRGIASTLEIARLGSAESTSFSAVSPFAFASVGHVDPQRMELRAGRSWTLASAGAGIRGSFRGAVSWEAWIAVPLRDGPRSDPGEPAYYARITKGW